MFERNLAFIIGINNYSNGISPLNTAVNDAKKLVEILRKKHGYKVWVCLDKVATLTNLNQLLYQTLPEQVSEDDRLLFYFAGHGVALNGSDGPAGYLIPQDATQGDTNTYIAMTKLHDALSQLPCRHFLGILDCCFAGAFRWSTTRDLLTVPEVIHKERYNRFITDAAWQIITSSASDQTALDNFNLDGERGQVGNHSPFAAALLEALEGAADIYPPPKLGKPAGDGVITATELYLYLRDRVEIPTEKHRLRQTPGIWCLNKHDKGEYIFLSPEHELNLPPAPPLDKSQNPYRGLQAFEEEHSKLFFGRQTLTEQLYQQVCKQPLTIVLGASGTGKSSLVKAGLIPYIKKLNPDNVETFHGTSLDGTSLDETCLQHKWHILTPMRPGEWPRKALNNTLIANKLLINTEEKPEDISTKIGTWLQRNPQSKLLLVIDQTEELLTICRNEQEREDFLDLLADLVTNYSEGLRIVLTLRSDFEPQLQDTILKEYWHKYRFVIPEMTREELRSCIEEPASARVMYFEPPSLIEELIDEVAQMPGALPLLSFTLSELYLKYLKAVREGTRQDRVITQADYEQLGGVARSLTQRADSEYEALVELDQIYKRTIRHVMVRMLAVSGGELARRRVPLSELEYPEPENTRVKEVIKRFTDARLLVEGRDTEGNPYVEPAHDALVRGWKKLLEWKEDEGETIILQRRLTPAAVEWKSQQEAKFLWNSHPQLNLLKQVLNSDDNWLNQVEAEFVRRSIRQKGKNTVLRRVSVVGVSLLAILLLIVQILRLKNETGQHIKAAKEKLDNNQQLNAVIDSLRAGKTLKDPLLQSFKLYPQLGRELRELRKELRGTLQEVVFQTKERNRQGGPEGKIRSALSLDGEVLVRVGGDSSIRVWDLRGKLLKKWEAGQGELQRVSFSPNSKEFVTTGDGKRNDIRLWNLQGERLQTFEGHQGLVNGISFSPDGKLLASGGKDDTVRLWNLQGKQLGEFKANQGGVKSIQFSLNGKELVTAGKNGTIRLWDLQGKQKAQGIGHFGPVSNVQYSPDGKLLLSGGEDKDVRLWNLQGQNLQKCSGHTGKIWSVDFSPNGQQFASVAGDGTIRLWNLQCQLLEKFLGHDGPIRSINFTPNGERLASTGDDGTFRIWDFQGRQPRNLKNYQGKVWSVAFSPTKVATREGFGRQLVSAGDDGTIRWNLQNQYQSGREIEQRPVNSVSFSPNSQLIANAGKDGNIYLSDLDGKPLVKLEGHQGPVKSVDFSPDGKLLASAGEDSTVRLWNLKGELLHILNNHVGVVNSVSFSPNGQLFVSAGEDSTVRLWNLQGQLLRTLDNHLDAVNSVNFSPDGKLFASGGEDDNIRLWNLQGEQVEIFQLRGQNVRQQKVTSVAFDPDGERIFSRDRNGNVQLWDFQGELLAKWETDRGMDKGFLNSFSVSQDGKLLATVGNDGSVKLWEIETLDRLIARVCKWVGDYLQHNPSVGESDRDLCDDVTETITSPISSSPSPPKSPISPISSSPSPPKSPISRTPSPTTSPLTAKKFLPSLQSTPEDYYTRGSNPAEIKYIQNSTQTINNPNSSNFDRKNAYINRGVVYFRQKKYHSAIADYTKVIKDWDRDTKADIAPTKSQLVNAYVNRGIAYSSLQEPQHQLAIKDYDRAIAIHPDYADAYINRGIAYSGLSKHETAIQDYTKAIGIAPENADIYYAKAFTQSLMEGKKQEAIENYEKAADLYQQQAKPSYSRNAQKKIEELKNLSNT